MGGVTNGGEDCNIFVEDEHASVRESHGSQRKKYQEEMIKWLEGILSQKENSAEKDGSRYAIRPIFIVGHHPFYYVGHKAKKSEFNNLKEMGVIYDIIKKYGIKFYLCADEHNFQYLYDEEFDIHHIISGGAAGGEETLTSEFDYFKIPYSAENPPFLSNKKINKKMLINSPHYVNFRITSQAIEFSVYSLTTNQYHLIEHLKKEGVCKDMPTNINSLEKNFGICYRLYVPKYTDYIYISDCVGYKLRKPKKKEKNKEKNKETDEEATRGYNYDHSGGRNIIINGDNNNSETKGYIQTYKYKYSI